MACFGEFLRTAHPQMTSLGELTRDHIEEFTAFARTRGYRRETAKVERAGEAMARCQREDHTPDEDEEG